MSYLIIFFVFTSAKSPLPLFAKEGDWIFAELNIYVLL